MNGNQLKNHTDESRIKRIVRMTRLEALLVQVNEENLHDEVNTEQVVYGEGLSRK